MTTKRLAPLFLHLIIVAAITVASAILYLPVFQWFTWDKCLSYGYQHCLAFIGLLSLALYRLSRLRDNPFLRPTLIHPCALIWLGASGLYLFNEANMGMNILSFALLILYGYGLLGHFIATSLWRSMLLPILLTILTLPFERYLDVFLGFPLRLLCAKLAGSLLQLTHLPVLTVESILMIDNRAAIVGLDCSGIRSLWVGAIFYVLLSWIEGWRLNTRWFVTGIIFLLLLIATNILRIATLVTLDLVVHLPLLANMMHQFLGLLGFVVSCLVAWWLLHDNSGTRPSATAITKDDREINEASPLVSGAILLSLILVFIALYQPMGEQTFAATPHTIQLPSRYNGRPADLSAKELDFFATNYGRVQKSRFSMSLPDKSLEGSIIMVWSKNWRTHHVPVNCYQGQGYNILDKGIWVLNQQSAVRFISLNGPHNIGANDKPGSQTAIYWFQSATGSTADYSARVLDGLLKDAQQWVMISILLNQTAGVPEVSTFINEIQILIDEELNKQS